MTDQPTTWTLERALAMLRDYKTSRIEGEIGRFIETWGNLWPVLPIAIAALESAAAEIAKERARADAAEKEVERMRAELATVAKREADGVALFDDLLARERAEVAKLRAELAAKQPAEAEAAQQGPSDEEIDSAIDSVRRHRLNSEDAFIETYHALRKIARRAGVKL